MVQLLWAWVLMGVANTALSQGKWALYNEAVQGNLSKNDFITQPFAITSHTYAQVSHYF